MRGVGCVRVPVHEDSKCSRQWPDVDQKAREQAGGEGRDVESGSAQCRAPQPPHAAGCNWSVAGDASALSPRARPDAAQPDPPHPPRRPRAWFGCGLSPAVLFCSETYATVRSWPPETSRSASDSRPRNDLTIQCQSRSSASSTYTKRSRVTFCC
ncbi:hypothetical protein BC628DRAFT_843675 [Trametes gibbosa]|nr:hypothetical protein BC628DRAFT_843675 [Trametes gibbosa]